MDSDAEAAQHSHLKPCRPQAGPRRRAAAEASQCFSSCIEVCYLQMVQATKICNAVKLGSSSELSFPHLPWYLLPVVYT